MRKASGQALARVKEMVFRIQQGSSIFKKKPKEGPSIEERPGDFVRAKGGG